MNFETSINAEKSELIDIRISAPLYSTKICWFVKKEKNREFNIDDWNDEFETSKPFSLGNEVESEPFRPELDH